MANMDPKKRENVMAMRADERFAYFVRKVADFEQVWGLYDEGWATADNGGDAIGLPFWPEQDFAAACAVDAWDKYAPKAIPLSEFLAKWLPGMARDSRLVAVFPTERDTAVFASPYVVMTAIQREMEQHDGVEPTRS
jgi:hypothetical protein